MYNKRMNFKEWSALIIGIRKSLNLSQSELCRELNLARCTVLRWENRKKYPRKLNIKKILEFVNKNGLDIQKLILIGKSNINGYSKDTRVQKLDLNYSKELAELIMETMAEYFGELLIRELS